MNKHCIVCDHDEATALYPGIVRCTNCGYVYADLDMDQSEFESLYTEGYFNGEEYSDYVADKQVAQRNFSDRLEVLKRFVDTDSHKSLIEIGCAYGFFLELAAKEFEYAEGVDVTPEGIEYARNELGLNAQRLDLLDWDFSGRQFDVACMWDVIEHLRAPHDYIERLAENMSEGGLLTITTGDIDSRVAKWRKQNWRLIHPPTHAHYFSLETLTRLLDKYGFDVIHHEYSGFYRNVDTIAYIILVLRWKMPLLYKVLKRLGLINWNFYSNFQDIMYVIAKRR